MEETRKIGRQKKRWEDYIRECTGMDFASSTRTAEKRIRRKETIAKTSVARDKIQ